MRQTDQQSLPHAAGMSENGLISSCAKLTPDAAPGERQQQFYALVLTHPQQHSFDIAVTDGEKAWRGTGLKVSRPPGFTEEEAWVRARELLQTTDANNAAAKPASLKAQQLHAGELQFTWSWERDVGAGRHVMRLPDPAAAAAAAATGAAGGQQPPPGVLLQQQQPHSTISHILNTLVTSYSSMQASLSVSSASQSSLVSSLEVLRGQLDSQAAAHKDRERELYLKFTMLLNQKTRQLQKEHELVKQLSAEVERLKGEAEVDTDDEALQAAYAADEAAAEQAGLQAPVAAAAAAGGADTEPGSDDDPPAAAAKGRQTSSAAAAAAAAAGHCSSRGAGSLVIPDSEGLDAPGGVAAAAAGAAAAGAGGGGGGSVRPGSAAGAAAAPGGGGLPGQDLDLAATQLLPEEELMVFQQQLGS